MIPSSRDGVSNCFTGVSPLKIPCVHASALCMCAYARDRLVGGGDWTLGRRSVLPPQTNERSTVVPSASGRKRRVDRISAAVILKGSIEMRPSNPKGWPERARREVERTKPRFSSFFFFFNRSHKYVNLSLMYYLSLSLSFSRNGTVCTLLVY